MEDNYGKKKNLACSNPSNFNNKPQVESWQQHFALYMDRHRLSVAFKIEVTRYHTECTYFYMDYSQMPAVALQAVSILNFQKDYGYSKCEVTKIFDR